MSIVNIVEVFFALLVFLAAPLQGVVPDFRYYRSPCIDEQRNKARYPRTCRCRQHLTTAKQPLSSQYPKSLINQQRKE
jgi:hypothetical protein